MYRKLRVSALYAITILFGMMQITANAGETVGVRQIQALSKERGTPLDITIWYPAKPGGVSVTLGDTAFFSGTSSVQDARFSDRKHPLILLSHGAGLAGNAHSLSWIAAPLAKKGFIVAAPTHPGNTGLNKSASETMKLWLRPRDITETLDSLHKDRLFDSVISYNQIGILGLSMGGNTALALAGARLESERLAHYCDTDALNQSLCGWVRQSGVDLQTMDLRAADRNNVDKRIRFAMAIDPAPADLFNLKSLTQISIPVTLVNLGRQEKIPITAQASDIAKAIPNARYITIEDASHYSMFGECKPGTFHHSEAQVGEPICTDGGTRSRNEIHRQLIDLIGNAFARGLSVSVD